MALLRGGELAVFGKTPEPGLFCPGPYHRPEFRQIRNAGDNPASLNLLVGRAAARRGNLKVNQLVRYRRTAAGFDVSYQKQRRPGSPAAHPGVPRAHSLEPK